MPGPAGVPARVSARLPAPGRLAGRLSAILAPWQARLAFGAAMGVGGLLVEFALNGVTDADTGFAALYLFLVLSAASGGMVSALTTTVVSVVGQGAIFYEPVGSFAVGSSANVVHLGFFAATGTLVSLITNGLLRARVRAERASNEVALMYEAEQAARRAAQQAEIRASRLQDVTAALAQASTPAEVADVIVDLGLGSLGATEGSVSLLSDDGMRVDRIVAKGYPAPVAEQYRSYPIDLAIPAADALRRGVPVILESPAEIEASYPAYAEAFALVGAQSVVALPFEVDGRIRGGVNVLFSEPRHLTAAERVYMEALARECGQALVRARLREAEEQARADAAAAEAALGFLADVGDILSSSFDYEITLNRIAGLAVRVLADRCSVDIRRDDGTIECVATAFAHPGSPGAGARESIREPTAGAEAVIATGGPVLVATIPDGAMGEGPDAPGGVDVRSYMAVPLRRADGPFGAITFVSETPGRFNEEALAIASDLAARASAAVERALLFREATQFIATVDASLDAVFMYDPVSLRFTYVNQGAVNQVGFTRAELLAMSAIEIKPEFDEAGYRELIAPLLSGERPSITFTTTHLHRDGTHVPVEVFLQGVRLPGGNVRMIVTARDIRQQIEVEANLYRLARAERSRAAELSAVIRGMGEGVLVCDPGGRVILSNPAVATILSTTVERYEDLVSLLEPPADGLPRLGAAAGPVEVRMADTDRWLDVSTYPVSLESGDLSGEAETTIIMLRDVTAARNARAAREAFIGVMSHELRTPITTIYGTTKLFSRAATSPELMRSMLVDVEAEADRLYRLVEDLLILSRSESGIEVEGEPVLLQHIVRSVIRAESIRWPETDFAALVPGGLPPVSGDRTHLEQVVRNLLANAAKYSPPGTRVEVQGAVEGGDVVIRVLDSGPGFSADEAKHLFELFYRSPSTSKKATGAGIGLYVSKALIEAMGGRIWAQPRPGVGAEFGFSVPILEVDYDPDDVDEAPPAG